LEGHAAAEFPVIDDDKKGPVGAGGESHKIVL